MTNNLEIASVSITIVTHYRPRPNYCENVIFNDKKCNANMKLVRIKLMNHLKHVFPKSVANIKEF